MLVVNNLSDTSFIQKNPTCLRLQSYGINCVNTDVKSLPAFKSFLKGRAFICACALMADGSAICTSGTLAFLAHCRSINPQIKIVVCAQSYKYTNKIITHGSLACNEAPPERHENSTESFEVKYDQILPQHINIYNTDYGILTRHNLSCLMDDKYL
ncbi:MAG: hypothetical protein MHMPM18_000337 [Marteilia pararefringens]